MNQQTTFRIVFAALFLFLFGAGTSTPISTRRGGMLIISRMLPSPSCFVTVQGSYS